MRRFAILLLLGALLLGGVALSPGVSWAAPPASAVWLGGLSVNPVIAGGGDAASPSEFACFGGVDNADTVQVVDTTTSAVLATSSIGELMANNNQIPFTAPTTPGVHMIGLHYAPLNCAPSDSNTIALTVVAPTQPSAGPPPAGPLPYQPPPYSGMGFDPRCLYGCPPHGLP